MVNDGVAMLTGIVFCSKIYFRLDFKKNVCILDWGKIKHGNIKDGATRYWYLLPDVLNGKKRSRQKFEGNKISPKSKFAQASQLGLENWEGKTSFSLHVFSRSFSYLCA